MPHRIILAIMGAAIGPGAQLLWRQMQRCRPKLERYRIQLVGLRILLGDTVAISFATRSMSPALQLTHDVPTACAITCCAVLAVAILTSIITIVLCRRHHELQLLHRDLVAIVGLTSLCILPDNVSTTLDTVKGPGSLIFHVSLCVLQGVLSGSLVQ